MYTVIM